ncbi:CynX/NimT family MFS transporter [Salinicoccus kekensis]|uniref:CP family cyanate transporter-like MFS transporter n=1 Tax=Salinicoccus kekensis TaxID=714307 RepID=A0A285U8W9_9STAP|nr:MFS transporter [Salinicoccus kekensis]SOC38183.1 CP family cyanate transporter-like MFS transporter [Salinicoccus kekensis]
MSVRKERYYIALLLLAIIFIGGSLRSPISSIGPLVPFFSEDLGLSNTMIGFLNTLPLLAFGLFSPFIPGIARKYGMEIPLLISMVFLTAGIFMRGMDGTVMLFFGTAVIGLSIAVGNVLSPGLIKATFPFKVGLMTGLYSFSMNIVSALSAGLSVSVAASSGYDWRTALAMWGIFPLIAVFVLILRMPRVMEERKKVFKTIDGRPSEKLWNSPLAWAVTFYMGLQSLIPYTLFAWLPAILVDKGFSETEAGWMLTIYQLGLLPTTFIAPLIAYRFSDQRVLGVSSGLMFATGLLGVLLMPVHWMIIPFLILTGIGAGTTFSLAMMFFVLRSNSVEQSAQLSGMAQSVGYVLAATGPLLLGMLAEYTGSWSPSMMILILVSLMIAIFGYFAGSNRTVTNGIR